MANVSVNGPAQDRTGADDLRESIGRVFTEHMLKRAVPKWWQVRRRLKARRFARVVREQMAQERFQFMGRREEFLAWDDYPVVAFDEGLRPGERWPPDTLRASRSL